MQPVPWRGRPCSKAPSSQDHHWCEQPWHLYVQTNHTLHPVLMKEMKLKILGSPLPSSRVDKQMQMEMEMDTLGPPQPNAVMERKKSRVTTRSWMMTIILKNICCCYCVSGKKKEQWSCFADPWGGESAESKETVQGRSQGLRHFFCHGHNHPHHGIIIIMASGVRCNADNSSTCWSNHWPENVSRWTVWANTRPKVCSKSHTKCTSHLYQKWLNFLLHMSWWYSIRTLPSGGIYWVVHPRRPRDFPKAKPQGLLEVGGDVQPIPHHQQGRIGLTLSSVDPLLPTGKYILIYSM